MHKTFMGLKIVISDYVDQCKSVPRRRHKRRRIQKKWTKRFGWKTVLHEPSVIVAGDTVIMSNRSYEALCKEASKNSPPYTCSVKEAPSKPSQLVDYKPRFLTNACGIYGPPSLGIVNPCTA